MKLMIGNFPQHRKLIRVPDPEVLSFGTYIQSIQSTSQDIIESNMIIVEPIS